MKKKQNKTEFKITELGLIPEDWEVVRLGEINSYQKETINPSENPRLEKVWFVESGSNYRLIGSTEWIPIEASDI